VTANLKMRIVFRPKRISTRRQDDQVPVRITKSVAGGSPLATRRHRKAARRGDEYVGHLTIRAWPLPKIPRVEGERGSSCTRRGGESKTDA